MKAMIFGSSSIVVDFDGIVLSSGVGEKGIGKSTGKPLHYKGSHFHRIIRGFMAQVCCLLNALLFFHC